MVEQQPRAGNASVPERTSRGLGGAVIATLAGSGLLLVFMLQNREPVTLHFLLWSFSWPLWLFTLTVAVLGAFVWIGLGVIRRHRRRKARREERAS